jgi:hypothetical protein
LAARRPVLAFILILLAAAGPAAAATPQQIYKDLADNGRIDGKYRRADIARAFNLERVIRTDPRPAARRPAAVTPAPSSSNRRSTPRVPFTGLDLALLLVGGGPLLLIGIGLRRRLGAPAPKAVVGG